jgi:Ca-activated chloride channel family protein
MMITMARITINSGKPRFMLELLRRIVPPLARARRVSFPILLMALGIAAGPPPEAQTSAQPPAQPPLFTSETSLVEVYATVTSAGEPLTSLASGDFEVYEDGQRQAITAFASGDVPLSLAIAVDRSFSMPPARIASASVAAQRLARSLEPDDRVMAIAIGSEIETLAPLAPDREKAASALSALAPWGTTPLYDATLAAVDAIQQGTGRRALVLFTDGADRYSDATAESMIAAVRERDVLVYPVVLRERVPAVLEDVAASTGARAFAARNDAEMLRAAETIVRELRAQYLLGYTPRRPMGGGEWRSIRVAVTRTGAQIRARTGYYAR